ncbi:MAG: hypothetical protein IJC74_05375 [Clostridia bacterium]|nr:hypothetical protein [Clostridia bacterium]
MKKRLMAMLMVLAMCLTMLPLAAFAAEDYTITLACDSTYFKPMNDVKSVVELDAVLTVGGAVTASGFIWSTDSSALKLTSDGKIVLDKNTVNDTYNVTATSSLNSAYTETFEITVGDGANPEALTTAGTTDRYSITTGPVYNLNSWVTLSFAHNFGWAMTDLRNIFQIGTERSGYADILILGKSGTNIADFTNENKVLGSYPYGNHTVAIEMNAAKKLYNLYVDGALLAGDQPFNAVDPIAVADRIYINYSDASDIHLYSGKKIDYSISLVGDSTIYKPMNNVKSVVDFGAKLTVNGVETDSDFIWSTNSDSINITADGKIILDKNTVNGTYNITATSSLNSDYSETFAITVADGILGTGKGEWNYNVAYAEGINALTNRFVTFEIQMQPHSSTTELINIGQSQGWWTYFEYAVESGNIVEKSIAAGTKTVICPFTADISQNYRFEYDMVNKIYNFYIDDVAKATGRALPYADMRNIAGKLWFKQSVQTEIAYYSGKKLETVAISGETTVYKPLGDIVSKVKYTADKAVNWSTNDVNTAIDANGNLYLNKNSASSIIITATDKTDSVIKGTYTVTVTPGYWQDFSGEPTVNSAGTSEIYTPGVFTDYEGQRVFGSWGSVSGIHFDVVASISNTGIATIDFDYKRNFNNVEKFIGIGKSQNWGEYITINAVEKDGAYTLTDVATETEIGTVKDGWHNFKIELDFNNGLYDFRVDGVKLADNVAFDKADARGIGKALIPSGYVDNLAVYSGTEAINSSNNYELKVNSTEPYGNYAEFEAKVFVNNESAKSYNVIIAQYEKTTNKLLKVVSNEASLNGEGMISALLKNTGESAGTYVKVMVVDSAAKLTPYGNAVTVNSAE